MTDFLAALFTLLAALLAPPAPAPALPAPLPACVEEDGSTPGQAFPCRWDATVQGNGQGDSYTLTGPA